MEKVWIASHCMLAKNKFAGIKTEEEKAGGGGGEGVGMGSRGEWGGEWGNLLTF